MALSLISGDSAPPGGLRDCHSGSRPESATRASRRKGGKRESRRAGAGRGTEVKSGECRMQSEKLDKGNGF